MVKRFLVVDKTTLRVIGRETIVKNAIKSRRALTTFSRAKRIQRDVLPIKTSLISIDVKPRRVR